MRENLPVFSYALPRLRRGGPRGSAALLLVFPLFGFSEYLLLATFAGEIAGLGVAGGTPTTNATHQ
jgi:hypothetical protein